jgi:hypothetical protein
VQVFSAYSTFGKRVKKYIYQDKPLCLLIKSITLKGHQHNNDTSCCYYADAVTESSNPVIEDFSRSILKRFDHSVVIHHVIFKLASHFKTQHESNIYFLDDLLHDEYDLVCTPVHEGSTLTFHILSAKNSIKISNIIIYKDKQSYVTGCDYQGSTFVTTIEKEDSKDPTITTSSPYFVKQVTFDRTTEGIFHPIVDDGVYLLSIEPIHENGARLTCVYSRSENTDPKISDLFVLAGQGGEQVNIETLQDGIFLKWNADHYAEFKLKATRVDNINKPSESGTVTEPHSTSADRRLVNVKEPRCTIM